jgi:O-antigen/teichoic acid export membrane protein
MKPRSQRAFFLESVVLSVIGIGVYNAALQFLVYPVISRRIGAEAFGHVLTLLSVLSVAAVAVGAGVNYARMANVPRFDAENGDYNRCLLPGLLAVALFAALALGIVGAPHPASWALYPLLVVVSTLRYYGNVAYRMEVNYRKNFLFYLLLSVGYGLGILLFLPLGVWEIALLIGELFAVGYVVLSSSVLRRPFWKTSPHVRKVRASCGAMIPAQLFSNLTIHADRLLIGALLDGTQVTVFYIASLLGKAIAMLTDPIAGVAIGFLARSKSFGRRQFLLSAFVSLLLGALAFVAFIPIAPFLIGILYPDVAADAKPFFLVANGGQIIYFIANLLLVILLRFASEKIQFYINVTYSVLFFVVCVPALLHGGLPTFCMCVLLLNAARLAVVLAIGFRKSKGERQL